jgi:hypothetical protein
VLCSCGGGASPSPSPTSLETFKSQEQGFSIAWDKSETRVTQRGEMLDDKWHLEVKNVVDSGKSLNGEFIPYEGWLEVLVDRLASPLPQSGLDEETAEGLTVTLAKQAREARRQGNALKIITPYELVTMNGMRLLHAAFLSKTEIPFWIHNEVFITTDGSRVYTIRLTAWQEAWKQHEEQALEQVLGTFKLL